ncbi:MAG: PAS domain S-box protein [Deltaproteobacteria bacterium]|nr:PAS domain S-box protein [Deltaproteobacteria bacterium]
MSFTKYLGLACCKSATYKEDMSSEIQRRRREKRLIFLCTLVFSLLTVLEVSLSKLSSKVSLVTSLLFFVIVNINILLLGLLVFLVFRNIIKIFLERKDSVFGAKLKSKLIVVFVGFALIPTILLFTISALYIHNSFGKWFNTQVKASLKGGVEISRNYYKMFQERGEQYAGVISHFVSSEKLLRHSKKDFFKKSFSHFREQFQISFLEFYFRDLSLYDSSTDSRYADYSFPRPPEETLLNALKGVSSGFTQNIGEGNLVRVVVPVFREVSSKKVDGILVVNFFTPLALAMHMEKIESTYKDYSSTYPFAPSIQSSYFLLLILMTLLIVFTATWFGFYLARQLTTPIKNLASATEEIASGNLDVHLQHLPSQMAAEEFDSLTQSFNQMTLDLKNHRAQIAQAHSSLQEANKELNQRRKYIEAILRNITAGVISLDAYGLMTTINRSAEALFGVSAKDVVGRHYHEVIPQIYLKAVDEFMCDIIEKDSIAIHEKQFQFPSGGQIKTLLASVAGVRNEDNDYSGMVVVIEDLTELLTAQKVAAWREIAKQIAHEIKNPLTPIKLSAQRLRKRYSDIPEKEVFSDCVQTIINQVDDLKDMIDEFSDFARLPQPKFHNHRVSLILKEVIDLYQIAHPKVQILFEEQPDVPLQLVDRDQIKRVFINLFDNAIDAMKKTGKMKICIKYNPYLKHTVIEISDSGCGVDHHLRSKIFLPYFTTKMKGGGLGLAIVQRIIEEHHGVIRIVSSEDKGAMFIIELPVEDTIAPWVPGIGERTV